jgi:Ca2+-binding RTX toxin-like protein
MLRGRKQAIVAGALSLAAGAGMAFVVAGAADGSAQRNVTIANTSKVLTIFGSPEAESLTVSGRSSGCCMTIDSTSTFSEFSDDCDYDNSGTFKRVICNVSKLNGVEAPLNDSNDLMTVVGRVPILTIRGQTGEDLLVGGDSGETLHGDGGDDRIRGGGGKDNINGGRGMDKCKGSREAKIKQCES